MGVFKWPNELNYHLVARLKNKETDETSSYQITTRNGAQARATLALKLKRPIQKLPLLERNEINRDLTDAEYLLAYRTNLAVQALYEITQEDNSF